MVPPQPQATTRLQLITGHGQSEEKWTITSLHPCLGHMQQLESKKAFRNYNVRHAEAAWADGQPDVPAPCLLMHILDA